MREHPELEEVLALFARGEVTRKKLYARLRAILGEPAFKKLRGTHAGIKNRCKSGGYANFDERLNDLVDFLREIGPPPSNDFSVDRIDNELGYEPGNIRWADAKTQALNRRSTIRIRLAGSSEPLTVEEASQRTGMTRASIYAINRAGLSLDDVVRRRSGLVIHPSSPDWPPSNWGELEATVSDAASWSLENWLKLERFLKSEIEQIYLIAESAYERLCPGVSEEQKPAEFLVIEERLSRAEMRFRDLYIRLTQPRQTAGRMRRRAFY